ncbi:murein biosynthesis integral membrane protein MurJ [Maritalea porphyrae]|uniref:murein biosynthesis integral membrane protein MurJ n=1 Tax=Maritalea porphyrae TaxID=880732 RepID=UPI0022AFF7B5|nr:murein biosynthesis integral membrane protein MurJ [Maritalea porphyrae]MCZ4272197.1 murein biosynthesis integral membrane protein MurJ [Maritalea porphyrae]
MSLIKNFASVGGATLLSRLLGFARDIMMAGILGAGPVADAFVAAFRLPNMFRRILAEGVFNTAFIPLFAKALEQKGEEEARRFSANIVSSLIYILLALTLLAEIFMPQLILVLTTGFADDQQKFDLTVLLARICFPYLACMSLMAAYGAILNGLRKFFLAALAPTLLNVVLVTMLGYLVFVVHDTRFAAIVISCGVLVGGIAQIGLVAWALKQTGFFPGLTVPKIDNDLKKFWALAIPAILTGGVTQINILVGTNIASSQDSAIAYLYYADRLYQLPLGMIGIAIGIVLLPELSRLLKSGEQQKAANVQSKSLFFGLMLTLPAAVGLYVIANPLLVTLFQRGAFDGQAANQSAQALQVFALGLPAFVLVKVFQPSYFAREDTRTPAIFAAVSVVLNIGFSLLLFPRLGHVGIAWATTISGWANVIMLIMTLAFWRELMLPLSALGRTFSLMAISAIMGAILYFAADFLSPQFVVEQFPLWWRASALSVLVFVGAGSYFFLLHLFGIQRLNRWRDFLKS